MWHIFSWFIIDFFLEVEAFVDDGIQLTTSPLIMKLFITACSKMDNIQIWLINCVYYLRHTNITQWPSAGTECFCLLLKFSCFNCSWTLHLGFCFDQSCNKIRLEAGCAAASDFSTDVKIISTSTSMNQTFNSFSLGWVRTVKKLDTIHGKEPALMDFRPPPSVFTPATSTLFFQFDALMHCSN